MAMKVSESLQGIFARRMYHARRQRGMSIEEVAVLSNITPLTLLGYEGSQACPRADNLVAIANALNVSTDYLLGRTDLLSSTCITPARYPALAGLCEQMSEDQHQMLVKVAEAIVTHTKERGDASYERGNS